MSIRNIDEVIEQAREVLKAENSDLATFPNYGNLYAIFRSIGALLIEQDAKLENTTRDLFLSTATGDALNNKAAEFSVVRREGTPASGSVLVSGPRTVIPSGTILTDPTTGIQLRVIDRVNTASAARTSLGVSSIDQGPAANLLAGTILKSTLYPAHQFVVAQTYNPLTNSYEGGLNGGTTRQTDIEVREAIRNRISTLGQSTSRAMEISALNIQGVSRVFVSDADPVVGFVTVYINSRSQSVQRHVKATLNRIKPVGISVKVKSFDVITVDVIASIKIRSSGNADAITNSVTSSISTYFTNLSPGESITTEGVSSAIYQVQEVTNVQLLEPTDSLSLEPNQVISLGNINLNLIL